MKKTGWIITLLVSIALVLITIVGLKPEEVSLAPGCLRPAIAISGWAALILSIVQLARTRKREA
jgi:hypothetical protein